MVGIISTRCGFLHILPAYRSEEYASTCHYDNTIHSSVESVIAIIVENNVFILGDERSVTNNVFMLSDERYLL